MSATHLGPLNTVAGVIPGTGRKAEWPCLDVYRMRDGKIEKFDCYNSATILLDQLGVLSNLEAAAAWGLIRARLPHSGVDFELRGL